MTETNVISGSDGEERAPSRGGVDEAQKEIEVARFLATLSAGTPDVAKPQLAMQDCVNMTSALCTSAYQQTVQALRAMGELTEYNAVVLAHLQHALHITGERAMAERRMVLNDDTLQQMAITQNPTRDVNTSWLISSRSSLDPPPFGAMTVDKEALRMADCLAAAAARFNGEQTDGRLVEMRNLAPQPFVNEAMRVDADRQMSNTMQRAALASANNLTYMQQAQEQANKVLSNIAPLPSLPRVTAVVPHPPPHSASSNLPSMMNKPPSKRAQAKAAKALALANGIPLVRKPRGRPPGSGKNQQMSTVKKRRATDVLSTIVLDDEKRCRLNDSCARVRPFDRASIDACRLPVRHASHVAIGNHLVKKPMHPAAVILPAGMPSKARSLTLQQYNEVMHRVPISAPPPPAPHPPLVTQKSVEQGDNTCAPSSPEGSEASLKLSNALNLSMNGQPNIRTISSSSPPKPESSTSPPPKTEPLYSIGLPEGGEEVKPAVDHEEQLKQAVDHALVTIPSC